MCRSDVFESKCKNVDSDGIFNDWMMLFLAFHHVS